MESNNTPAKTPVMPDTGNMLLSVSPHVQGKDTIAGIMQKVLLCLIPPVIASVIFFGLNALRVIVETTAFCLLLEWLCCKIACKPSTLKDYSAAVTGVILALNLPASVPWWVCLVGAIVAIVIAKAVYGGLGQNPFNPAAVARVALLVGFAEPMARFLTPCQGFLPTADFVTGATPLGLVHAANSAADIAALESSENLFRYFIGYMGGSLGETSVLAILTGGIGLLAFRLISWHIPVAMLGTTLVFTWIVHLAAPGVTPGPLFHLCTGGMMIAAFFMATDMVTSPITHKGKMIFGAAIALIACVIRIWGGYPEGISFAIVIMNALVPLIDRWCTKTPFGWHAIRAAEFQIRRGEVK